MKTPSLRQTCRTAADSVVLEATVRNGSGHRAAPGDSSRSRREKIEPTDGSAQSSQGIGGDSAFRRSGSHQGGVSYENETFEHFELGKE